MKKIAIASFRRSPSGSAFIYKQDIANEAYTDAIINSGAIPLIVPHLDMEYAEEALDGFSGLLIPGGHDIDPAIYGEKATYSRNYEKSEDLFQIALVKAAMKLNMPILGICRGMQLINTALGGTLYQDIENEYMSNICHTATSTPYRGVHRITIDKSSKLYEILDNDHAMVNSLHHQSIKDLGTGLNAVAAADDGVVEAIEGNGILGVQWHPEAMYSEMAMIFRYFVNEANNA